ncbi:MAG: hypothetical protein JJU36_11575 [Phycisphaeraceae bacterium]|nr:hypothetical protein [Phycisphaeraceae bacterium]
MSILTKVFAVLVTIMVVALVALLIPHAANQPAYREIIDRERSARQAAEAALTLENNALQARLTRQAEEISRLGEVQADLTATADRLNRELQEVRRRADAHQLNERRLTESNEGLRQENQRLLDLYNTEKQAKERALETQNTDQRRIAELETQLLEVRAQEGNLRRQVRFMEEQLAVIEGRMREMTARADQLPEPYKGMVTGTAATMPEFDANPAIQGRVARVASEGGQVFVQINVGTNDRVQPQMRFMVHRDGNFLGNVIISKVDEQSASGVLRLATGEVRVGDRVYSGPANPS